MKERKEFLNKPRKGNDIMIKRMKERRKDRKLKEKKVENEE